MTKPKDAQYIDNEGDYWKKEDEVWYFLMAGHEDWVIACEVLVGLIPNFELQKLTKPFKGNIS